jgi:hypothetical protein
MPVCPADFRPCIDDLCRGSGCMLLEGEPMLERCSGGCGAYVATDGSGSSDCQCEPVECGADLGIDDDEIPY